MSTAFTSAVPAEVRAATDPLNPISENDAAEYRTQKDGEPHFVHDEALNCDFRVQNGLRTAGADGADGPVLDHVLYLGPDSCFFNKTGNLRVVRSGPSTDQLNQLKDFSHVTGLHVKNQHLFWGFVVSSDFTAGRHMQVAERTAEEKTAEKPRSEEEKRAVVGGALLLTRSGATTAATTTTSAAAATTETASGGGAKVAADDSRTHVHFELRLVPERRGRTKQGSGTTTRTLVIRVDGKDSHMLHLLVVPNKTTYAANFDVLGLDTGYHTLEICLQDNYKYHSGFGALHYVKASSDDVKLAVVRERWRPFACHMQFSCSKAPRVRTYVMGMTQVVPSLRSYNPITSRYGYDGFCFDGNNGVASDNGMNMSAWSFGRKGSRPEMHMMSRGLFVGSARAKFSGFSHEGTGFKFRNFGPQWKGNTSGEFVLARRVIPEPEYVYGSGRVYRAMTFWFDEEGDRDDVPDEDKGRWRLYGILRFFSRQKIKSVLTRGFIEVPGPAEVQRTGHVPRTISYRGYVQSADNGRWHLLDRMKNYPGQHTNKVWTTNEDGTRFVASAGGLGFRTLEGPKTLQIVDDAEEEEAFEDDFDNDAPVVSAFTDDVDGFGLDPEEEDEHSQEAASIPPRHMRKIAMIDELEKNIPWPTLTAVSAGAKHVNVVVHVPDKADKNSTLTVMYGPKDCLTFENEWAHRTKKSTKTSDTELTLPRVAAMKPGATWFLRVLVRDRNLQAFSLDTYKFKV